MRYLLRDLTPGQEYAIQFRSNTGEQVSDWSQVQRFTTTDDVTPPSQVQNLSWYDSGSSFIGQWDKVTTQASNPVTALKDFRHYRVNVSNGSISKDYFIVGERFDYTKEMNQADFGSVQTILSVKVYAVDMTYNESAVATANASPQNPPTPSTPTIGVYLGLLYVQWDGKSAGGSAMPANTMYAEVHVSTTSNFTPSNTTFVGRVEVLGSASKMVVPGLVYGTTYYIKLIAVNELLKKSSSSAQASGTPVKLSGLDIQNGQISPDQINFTARDIGGANAYYSTSQPQTGVNGVGTLKSGDIWYDTDDGYKTYKYNGTTWALAPEIGVVAGTKILAGTLTSDAVGTNLLIASSANIENGIITNAKISDLSAAKITTGAIQAEQRIIAGPELENHAEMTSTGFYVKGPQPGTPLGQTPIIIDRIRMGTGVSDFFAIPDPLDPDSTLAQISEDGGASFQALSSQTDPTIMGRKLFGGSTYPSEPRWFNKNDPGFDGLLSDRAFKQVANGFVDVTGLNQSGNVGIRSEYGVAQFRSPVVKGRTYLVTYTPPFFYQSHINGEVRIRVRQQKDNRTVAQQIANPTAAAATQATTSSPTVDFKFINGLGSGSYQSQRFTFQWEADYTGYCNYMITLEYVLAAYPEAVVKCPDSRSDMRVFDMGASEVMVSGSNSSGGGSLYSYSSPAPVTPPPAAQTQQYYHEARFNWVRSYKGTGAYMSNTDGKAYQGYSSYNGNQFSHFGFTHVNYVSLLSGSNVDKVIVYLYFAHWYYNSGGIAVLGTHNNVSDPGTSNAAGGWYNRDGYRSGSWPKPGGRELDITSWAQSLADGGFRGITLGPGDGTNLSFYGYATDCVLKVWYTK